MAIKKMPYQSLFMITSDYFVKSRIFKNEARIENITNIKYIPNYKRNISRQIICFRRNSKKIRKLDIIEIKSQARLVFPKKNFFFLIFTDRQENL